MIYLLIANEAALQEHRGSIVKRAQSSVLCIVLVSQIFSLQQISRYLRKVGLFKKKSKKWWGGGRKWEYTLPLTCMTPIENSKIEKPRIAMAIRHDFFFITPGNSTSFLVDRLESPYAMPSIPPCLMLIFFWNSPLQHGSPGSFLIFQSWVLMNYFVLY